METIKRIARPISLVLAICMVLLSGPYQLSLATMIPTETAISAQESRDARQYVNGVLAREDVQTAFQEQGVNPSEAQERVNSLSDAEVVNLAARIENLPAGGDVGIVSALLIVFLVIVILKVI